MLLVIFELMVNGLKVDKCLCVRRKKEDEDLNRSFGFGSSSDGGDVDQGTTGTWTEFRVTSRLLRTWWPMTTAKRDCPLKSSSG